MLMFEIVFNSLLILKHHRKVFLNICQQLYTKIEELESTAVIKNDFFQLITAM